MTRVCPDPRPLGYAERSPSRLRHAGSAHFFLETPEANLVAGMQWLQNTYTRRFNTRHGLWGRLFGDRYKAVPVEGGSRYYYETLLDYIQLNPVRGGPVRAQRKES